MSPSLRPFYGGPVLDDKSERPHRLPYVLSQRFTTTAQSSSTDTADTCDEYS